MSDTILLVAGLGRCGTSVVLQMLSAGGLRCVGDYPAFEDERMNSAVWPASLLDDAAGGAVKMLTPQDRILPPHNYKLAAVWLARDLEQQAKSQLKYLRRVAKIYQPRAMNRHEARSALRQQQRKLASDERVALSIMRHRASVLVRMRFERILAEPTASAATLARLCVGVFNVSLDQKAMVRVVRRRGAGCLGDMLEDELIKEGGE